VVLAQDLLQTLIEVRLRSWVGFHSMRAHESLDLRVGVPLTAVNPRLPNYENRRPGKAQPSPPSVLSMNLYVLRGSIHDGIAATGFNPISPGR